MFKENDVEDLRIELGLASERADELAGIVHDIIDQEAQEGEYGRTSHILLNIAGRKDLNDVEKAACVFLFCCKILYKKEPIISKRRPKVQIPPEISINRKFIPRMGELKIQEFIDIEAGSAGMMIAPEGVGPDDAIGPIMAILISILRQIPKKDAQEFGRNTSLSFAKMAMTGDIRL